MVIGGVEDGGGVLNVDRGQHLRLADLLEPLHAELVGRLAQGEGVAIFTGQISTLVRSHMRDFGIGMQSLASAIPS